MKFLGSENEINIRETIYQFAAPALSHATELVLEVPEDEVDWLKSEIPHLMAGVAALRVPLLAEVGVGPNWDQAH